MSRWQKRGVESGTVRIEEIRMDCERSMQDKNFPSLLREVNGY